VHLSDSFWAFRFHRLPEPVPLQSRAVVVKQEDLVERKVIACILVQALEIGNSVLCKRAVDMAE
jgi:hypothetical protein